MTGGSDPARRMRIQGLPPGLTLVRQLGSSPLSEVFLVADDAGRLRALKVLRASAARDARIRQRWDREAQLLEEIRHPHLVRSHGALVIQGRPALLLEYVQGRSLRDRLKSGPLGWEEAARIGVQVGRALEVLHRHGALHRDVKPHNILLDAHRGAVLADLGLVRRREDPTLTAPGAALGSPAYMSPEQARDPHAVGPEADVYSLGATLHHALSGAPPFLGQGVGEVIHRVLHEEPEPLPATVPEALRGVVATALAKDPLARYARARDLARDLGRVLLGQEPRRVSRRVLRGRLVAFALSAGVLLAVGGVWLALPGAGPASDPAAAAPVSAPARNLSASAATAAAPEAGPAEAEPGPPAAAALGPRERFLRWAGPYENAYRTQLAAGRLRDALEEVRVLEDAALPAGAGEEFRYLRESLVRETRSAIHAAAERASVEAESLLKELREQAREDVQSERFRREDWESGVRAAWAAAGIPVAELPLRPGGPDPERYLRLTGGALEREAEELLSARAEDALRAQRLRTAELLRAGRFQEARGEWTEVKPEYLRRSASGRRERSRVEALAYRDEEVARRLDEMVGLPVLVKLRAVEVKGTVLPPLRAGAPHRLDPGNGITRPLDLMALDPEVLDEYLLVSDEKELRWLQAELYWCQGRVGKAIEVMAALQSYAFPADRDPAFWVAEWRRERARQAEGAGPSGEGANPPRDETPPAPRTAAERLAAEWRSQIPGAEIRAAGDGLEITWTGPDWSAPWQVDLRWDRRRWSVEAWRIEWRLAADAAPPRKWAWLGRVEFQQPPGTGPPVLAFGSRRVEGYGMVPGAAQTLEWRGGTLLLDGLPLGPLEMPVRPRLSLSARAEPAFRPARVWLRAAYHDQD